MGLHEPRPGWVCAWGAATDTGVIREVNEDSHLADFPVFMVADGMGGHEAGDRASAAVVDAIQALVGPEPVTVRDVRERLAEAEVRVRAIASTPGRDAGTTVAGAVVVHQDGALYWLVVNLGDSRTYLFRNGGLTQVSVDHSEVQELLDAGSITAREAVTHPRRNVVTRALGGGQVSPADFWLLPVSQGDRLLVCSDGLPTEIPEEEITRVLGNEPDPQQAADALVQAALAAGGHDNVTVVVVDAAADVDTSGDDADQDTIPRADLSEDTRPRVRNGATWN